MWISDLGDCCTCHRNPVEMYAMVCFTLLNWARSVAKAIVKHGLMRDRTARLYPKSVDSSGSTTRMPEGIETLRSKK